MDCLKKDVQFDPLIDPGKKDKQLASVLESVAYLDRNNTLLDENEDFQLSGPGVSKYQAKHMQVFDHLSQLAKPSVSTSNSIN